MSLPNGARPHSSLLVSCEPATSMVCVVDCRRWNMRVCACTATEAVKMNLVPTALLRRPKAAASYGRLALNGLRDQGFEPVNIFAHDVQALVPEAARADVDAEALGQGGCVGHAGRGQEVIVAGAESLGV
jgi:hypothetical protein